MQNRLVGGALYDRASAPLRNMLGSARLAANGPGSGGTIAYMMVASNAWHGLTNGHGFSPIQDMDRFNTPLCRM
jgi:hypothetical protein